MVVRGRPISPLLLIMVASSEDVLFRLLLDLLNGDVEFASILNDVVLRFKREIKKWK